MIKNNHGVTLSILVVTIIVILILSAITITSSDDIIRNTKSKSIVSNMYLIKSKVETIYEDYKFSNEDETDELPGTQVDVSSLLQYNVLPGDDSEEISTWYEWDKNTIVSLGFDESMLKGNSKYIVNYATGEVIYTGGIEDSSGNIKYKFSEVYTGED